MSNTADDVLEWDPDAPGLTVEVLDDALTVHETQCLRDQKVQGLAYKVSLILGLTTILNRHPKIGMLADLLGVDDTEIIDVIKQLERRGHVRIEKQTAWGEKSEGPLMRPKFHLCFHQKTVDALERTRDQKPKEDTPAVRPEDILARAVQDERLRPVDVRVLAFVHTVTNAFSHSSEEAAEKLHMSEKVLQSSAKRLMRWGYVREG